MSRKILVVVDMQNDFVTGALANEEAQKIIPDVVDRIKRAEQEGNIIIFTQDTHYPGYLETEEGRNLPIEHCIKDTKGWEIVPELREYASRATVYEKEAFGCLNLAQDLKTSPEGKAAEYIELIGICTDICVISNAMLIKAAFPNAHITVDAACCAGVTPENHRTALEAMEACQIEIVNK